MKKTINRGFTLVELLIVIGIIALLIAILLPALSKARFSAGQIRCLSNVRSLAQAALMYCGDNSGFYPYYDGTGDQHWTTALFGYVNKSPKLFECPLESNFIDAPLGGSMGVVGGSGINNNNTRYTVPSGGLPYTARLCYKCNGTGIYAATKNKGVSYPFGDVYDQPSGTTVGKLLTSGGVVVPRTMRFSNVAPDTVLIFDGFTQTINFGDRSTEHFGGPTGGGDPGAFDYRSLGLQSHQGRSVCMAFADYHAEVVQTGTLLKDPKYDINATSPFVGVSTSNLGRTGDLQIYNWNGSNEPFGHWSGNPND